MSITIFQKTYSSESLADAERDLSECYDPVFNPLAQQLPDPDEHGFMPGEFRITVEYIADEE